MTSCLLVYTPSPFGDGSTLNGNNLHWRRKFFTLPIDKGGKNIFIDRVYSPASIAIFLRMATASQG